MLFLYDVRSPANIGLTLRSAEQFEDWVAIYDPHHVLADKAASIAGFSQGALTRRPPAVVEGLDALRKQRAGRIIATTYAMEATPLHAFAFQDSDIVMLGNEADGLPADVVRAADERLYIPLPAGHAQPSENYPSLNVSVTAAIISYAWHTQRMIQWLALPRGPLPPRTEYRKA